jgi:hypothetical protein
LKNASRQQIGGVTGALFIFVFIAYFYHSRDKNLTFFITQTEKLYVDCKFVPKTIEGYREFLEPNPACLEVWGKRRGTNILTLKYILDDFTIEKVKGEEYRYCDTSNDHCLVIDIRKPPPARAKALRRARSQ